jgi:hypothetical protein
LYDCVSLLPLALPLALHLAPTPSPCPSPIPSLPLSLRFPLHLALLVPFPYPFFLALDLLLALRLPLSLSYPLRLCVSFPFTFSSALTLHRRRGLPILLRLALLLRLHLYRAWVTDRFCLFALGFPVGRLMPKKVETLLQVKERLTRELKSRTQARCAELLAGGPQERSGLSITPEPVSICLCCVCQQGYHSINLRARTRTPTAQRETLHNISNPNIVSDDDEVCHSADDTNVVALSKDSTTCINVTWFLLSLLVANCLFLQYIFLYKAERL